MIVETYDSELSDIVIRAIHDNCCSAPEKKVYATKPEIEPYKPKKRKYGTSCETMINDHLYEGRYTPTNACGKRESHNIHTKTKE